MCFFLICFAPWQKTLAAAGDGDGGHLGSFFDPKQRKTYFEVLKSSKIQKYFFHIFIYAENGSGSQRNTQNINT